MKDKRVWPFKRRAEEDNLISAGCCRMILRMASWRYCTKYHPADSEFSLSWRHIAAWYDNDGPETVRNRMTIYGWIREAVFNRYLVYCGKKGCPAQSCYRLELSYAPEPLTLFNWGAERAQEIVSVAQKTKQLVAQKTKQLVAQKTKQLVVGKIEQPVARKNRPPINKYFPSGRNGTKPKGRNSSLRSQTGVDKSSSLRSERRPPLRHDKGQDAPTMPQKSPAEDRATSPPDDPSAAVGRGGTNPPGRGAAHPSPSPLSKKQMLLVQARSLIENDQTHYMVQEHHMRIFLEDGGKPPLELVEKFPQICEQFNPMKG